MIKALRFVKREIDNGDGSAYTKMILQQLVEIPGIEVGRSGIVRMTTMPGEEWQDVPLEENP